MRNGIDVELAFWVDDICGKLSAKNEDEGTVNAGAEALADDDVGCDGGGEMVGGVFVGLTIVTPLPNKSFTISKSDAKLAVVAASALSETYHAPAVMPV